MDYAKPEIAVLGEATHLILGGKNINSELWPSQAPDIVADCELDD